MNKLIVAGALVGGILLVKRGLDYNALSKNISIELYKPRIHSVTLQGIVFATGIMLKNPIKIKVSITKPVITLSTNGTVLAASAIESKSLNIAGQSETDLGTLQLKLPWLPLLQLLGTGINVAKILEAWKKKNTKTLAQALKIPLEMAASLYVDNSFFVKTAPTKIN